MQMQVRRALERKKGDTANNVNPFLTAPVGGDTPVAVSSLTSASSGGVEVLFPQPKLKRIRRTANAMQQERMQTEEITMGDTHLDRQEETMKRELLITGANMTDTEWSAFCKQRQRKIDDRNQPPTAGGIGSTGGEYEEGSV